MVSSINKQSIDLNVESSTQSVSETHSTHGVEGLAKVDAVVGIDQTSGNFWGRIVNYFNTYYKDDQQRTGKQCKDYWNKINQKVTRFNGCYKQVQQAHHSGAYTSSSNADISEHEVREERPIGQKAAKRKGKGKQDEKLATFYDINQRKANALEKFVARGNSEEYARKFRFGKKGRTRISIHSEEKLWTTTNFGFQAESESSSRQSSSKPSQNEELKDWQDAWEDGSSKEVEIKGTDHNDAFWKKLKSAVEGKVDAADAEKFCKTFQRIHNQLVNKELSSEAAENFLNLSISDK
ncbi:hypothetical protein F8388_000753 [Cannabis sativa]|uniref:Myb-like domain-containing protein n=1 Tax=Cannabis sativa TaxID=3483 RepID=A0A7J6ED44_CANSA|nr:hypothetical protein F8388_000753 [Cannabis sativa]